MALFTPTDAPNTASPVDIAKHSRDSHAFTVEDALKAAAMKLASDEFAAWVRSALIRDGSTRYELSITHGPNGYTASLMRVTTKRDGCGLWHRLELEERNA